MNRVLPSVITLVVAAASAGCRKDAPLPAVRIETPVAPPHTSVGCTGSRYDGTGLGELRIGATVASIRSVCSVVRDTTELREEGMPTHVLAVAFGIDTVEAEIDSGRVWRIALGSSRFRTTDSLGVGVPIGRFLSMRGIHGITGEGALYLVSPTHCGLSFRVTDPILDAPPEDWTVAMLKRLPATSIVTEVLIVGCQAAA